MPTRPFDIVFLPERRRFTAAGPVTLYMAAAGAGLLVEQPCGAQGTCGRCRVRVVEGEARVSAADTAHLSASELSAGWRLACQLVLSAAAIVEVPAVARSLAGKSFGADLPAEALARPVIERRSGADRPLLGLAIDIGTTSLAAAAVSLDDGAVLASASSLNPQAAFGADVIARIRYTMERPDGLGRLTAAVRTGLADLVGGVLAASERRAADVVAAAVAGNPTMLHAWAGVGIATLGVAPYVGAWTGELTCKAADVGLPVHTDAAVYVFPQVRSHVGGDAVAAAVACNLDAGAGRRLLVDLGTNSEVLVTDGRRVVATSAAAGPAFEGVSIRHGMRAAPGAVDLVALCDDGRVDVNVVGGGPPAGICGSGLIDLVAGLLGAGLLDPSGRLRTSDELAGVARPGLAARLSEVDGQRAFTVVPAADAVPHAPIVVTARDIREVQLAKGSIVAAATLACRHLGLDLADLDEVMVAGAFGNFIRKASALRIGLVPRLAPERVRLVGNAAGLGARLALVDRDVRRRARDLAARTEYVELAGRPDYEAAFLEALRFPGTERETARTASDEELT